MRSWADEVYVEFDGVGDGSGTSGDPWGTFAYAMSELRAAGLTLGDTKVWVKKTASDDNSCTGLTDSDMPTTDGTHRLWIEGYNTSTGDGDITTAQVLTRPTSGEIINQSAGGDFQFWEFIEFDGLDGGTYVVRCDRQTHFWDCVFRGNATAAQLSADSASGTRVTACAFLGGRRMISASGAGAHVKSCFFHPSAKLTSSNAGVAVTGVLENSCFYIDNTSQVNGKIIDLGSGSRICFNSVWVNGSATGLEAIDMDLNSVMSYANYIEGAPVGIRVDGVGNEVESNRFYNCGTNIEEAATDWFKGENNLALASSGIAKAGTPDIAGFKNWFKPNHSERDRDGRLIGASFEHVGGSGGFSLSRIVNGNG